MLELSRMLYHFLMLEAGRFTLGAGFITFGFHIGCFYIGGVLFHVWGLTFHLVFFSHSYSYGSPKVSRFSWRHMTILVATRIAFLAVRRETVNSGRDLLLWSPPRSRTFCLLVKHSSESECEQHCQRQFGPRRFKFNSCNLSSSHKRLLKSDNHPLHCKSKGPKYWKPLQRHPCLVGLVSYLIFVTNPTNMFV